MYIEVIQYNYSEDIGEILSTTQALLKCSIYLLKLYIVNNLIAHCLSLFTLKLEYAKFDICMN
jgi:hypothetical protein